MQQWQHWITLGNQAFSLHQQQLAQQYYQQALADVWPVWYHCAFVECPVELNTDEAALPTHCLAVTLLNLAESYASQQRWRRCRRTLKQGLYWFEQMLEGCDSEHPATVAVLMHQSKLLLVSQLMEQRQLLALSEQQFARQGDTNHTTTFGIAGNKHPSDLTSATVNYLH
jgi:hypothetical protein